MLLPYICNCAIPELYSSKDGRDPISEVLNPVRC